MHFFVFAPLFLTEYVDEVRELVFSMFQAERNSILSKYKTETPAPLNSQFTDKEVEQRQLKTTVRENRNTQLHTLQVRLLVILLGLLSK